MSSELSWISAVQAIWNECEWGGAEAAALVGVLAVLGPMPWTTYAVVTKAVRVLMVKVVTRCN